MRGTSRLFVALTVVASLACGGGPARAPTNRGPRAAHPRAVRELVLGANAWTARGDAARATRHLERALEIDASLWEAHYDLGVIARHLGDLEAAERRLSRAHALAPGAREPILALAELALYRGDAEAAADRVRSAYESAPGDASLALGFASVLREAGDDEEALAVARDVLVRDPRNVGALLETARVHRGRGRLDVAELVLRKANEVEATAETHNELGLLALDRGDTQVAFREFARALELDAGYAPALSNQGAVLLRAGDYAGAEVAYRAVLEHDGGDLAARVALGVALRGKGELAEAGAAYREVLRTRPDHPDALFDLAVLEAEFESDRGAARAHFARFLEVAPPGHEGRATAERYVREITEEDAR